VSTILDRWSRRQILVITDSMRVVFALLIGAIVYSGNRSAPMQYGLAAVALLALSANRFLLAAISAAMAHTVNPDEYLSANTVMPLVGPVGAVIGARSDQLPPDPREVPSRVPGRRFRVPPRRHRVRDVRLPGQPLSRTALGPDHRHHHTAADCCAGSRLL